MIIGVIYLGRHGPGGVSTFELATHLAAKATVFAAVSSDADHIETWRESGIPLIETPTFRSTPGAAASLLNIGRIRRLARRIAAEKPDVVLYYMVHPWTLLLQRYLSGIPHVVTVHDPVPHPGLLHQASSLWERTAAAHAERSVVLGRAFVEQMRNHGISADRIDVIPHPEFSFYGRLAPDAPPHPQAPQSVLFFGRITAYKGLEILIPAFRALQARRPQMRLSIVGEGDMRPYKRLLDGAKNVEVVNRWVHDSEVAGFFQEAEVVVIPYTSASQSGVAALAASFERAVVATRTGAIPEQIHDGETGILVEPGSVSALMEGIERLLADGQLRDRLARQLSSTMRAAANWDAVSNAYLQSCAKAAKMRSGQ